MKSVIRTMCVLLLLATAGVLSAQETTTTTTTTTDVAPPATPARSSSNEIREQLTAMVMQGPDQLATLLALEPSLLANDAFLAGHPELARFVAEHPEVRMQPTFYISEFSGRTFRQGPLDRIIEPIMVFCGFGLVTYALAWLVRTLVDQRRWSQLARTQSDVHNKILDRFGTSNELLDYVKSPAGSRFLESAPIPLHAEQAPQNPPLARVLGSIQIGLILAAGSIGALLVSNGYKDETGQGLYTLGVIGLCVGGGFVISAAVSLFLSRRLGIWQAPNPDRDDTEQVR